MGRLSLSTRFVVPVAFAAVAFGGTAFAAEVISECPGDASQDAPAQLASDVQAARVFGYSSPTFMEGQSRTSWNIATGQTAETATWTPQDRAAIERLLARLPSCLIEQAGIAQTYRARPGLKSAELGFKGVVFSWQNTDQYNGGRTIFADLFFDNRSYNGALEGDQQMQIALGWDDCQPAADKPARSGESREAYEARKYQERLGALPPGLRGMSRERILFHEYIHGVTHQQKGYGRLTRETFEGFFAAGGPSRFAELQRVHLAEGSRYDTLSDAVAEAAALPASAENRAKYCAAVKKLGDYTARAVPSIPQRWPGDLHALESEDEYITILIESAMYAPEGSGYSPAELQWANDWWARTFGAPMGQCGAAQVAQGQPSAPAAAMGFTPVQKAPAKDWAAEVLGWFTF